MALGCTTAMALGCTAKSLVIIITVDVFVLSIVHQFTDMLQSDEAGFQPILLPPPRPSQRWPLSWDAVWSSPVTRPPTARRPSWSI